MEKILIGGFGVILGFFLNFIKEALLQRKAKQKELEYLAIRITSILEKFVNESCEVATDDGLIYGQRAADGTRNTQVKLPNFEPEKADVNWKVLPFDLMYEILNFHNDIESSNSYISVAFDLGDGPPDYNDGFEARQYHYSKLGLSAYTMSVKLREVAGLPQIEFKNWNPHQIMSTIKNELELIKTKREQDQKELLEKMRNNNRPNY